MARVQQITEKSQVAPEHHHVFDRVAQARGRVAGPYSILFHNPPVADRADMLANTLRELLAPQEFVLIALAVARAKDCLFVWSVQAPNARRAGVPDGVISAIRDRSSAGLSEDQADIVSYATQLASGNRVDQGTFDRLNGKHGTPWLVAATAAAGHFGLISGINNAFEVPPSAEGDKLPV
jgi:alkylhydroperoxidase family enzyme